MPQPLRRQPLDALTMQELKFDAQDTAKSHKWKLGTQGRHLTQPLESRHCRKPAAHRDDYPLTTLQSLVYHAGKATAAQNGHAHTLAPSGVPQSANTMRASLRSLRMVLTTHLPDVNDD